MLQSGPHCFLGEDNRLTETPLWVAQVRSLLEDVQPGLLMRDLSFPPSSAHSIKLSPQPAVQAQDAEKNQRTVTVNAAHMGKAFKVMNELRRYVSALPVPFQMEPEGGASSGPRVDTGTHHLLNSDFWPALALLPFQILRLKSLPL